MPAEQGRDAGRSHHVAWELEPGTPVCLRRGSHGHRGFSRAEACGGRQGGGLVPARGIWASPREGDAGTLWLAWDAEMASALPGAADGVRPVTPESNRRPIGIRGVSPVARLGPFVAG